MFITQRLKKIERNKDNIKKSLKLIILNKSTFDDFTVYINIYTSVVIKKYNIVSHPLNQIKMIPNWPKCALNTFLEISSKSLVWLSKSWASAWRFQIQVVVFGPFDRVREKWPGLVG